MVRDCEACDNSVLKEEETAMKLFGEELERFCSSGFDGSKKEHSIFADIFYGGSLLESNICAVTGASNSLRHGAGCCSRRACINFNLESSCNSSMKGSSGEALDPTKQINPKDISGLEQCSGPYAVKLNSKKRSSPSLPVFNHESEDHCCSYPWKKSKLIKSDSHSYQPCSLRIVESFAHGILSSYYSVKLGSMDVASVVDPFILNYRSSVQHIGEDKVGLEANFVTSPLSQESIAYGLLRGGSTPEDKEINRAVACVEQTTPFGGRLRRVTNREMPGQLESYAHSLLVDAGWRIEPRARKERNKMAYLFRKPDEGLVRSSLSSAWKTCGERLLYMEPEWDDQGREWSDINEFWSDLKEILSYIDMESQQLERKLSLLRRWQLLDPFLAVVFISRKISVLRMGKSVRAVRSATFVPDCSEDFTGNLNGNWKWKSKSLSSKHKSAERFSLVLNSRESRNSYGYDSPISSDLESEDLSGCSMKILSENELQHEPTNLQDMPSSLCEQENRSCVGRNRFCLNDKLNQAFPLDSSAEDLTHNKSKKVSDIEETEAHVRKRRLGSNENHRENSVYCLSESYSDLSYLPCPETSDFLASECLEPTVSPKGQTSDVLSTSEDESSHISEIQEASSSMEIYKENLKFENNEARKFDKDEISLISLERKATISFSSLNDGQDCRQPDKFMDIECNAQLTSSRNQSPTRSFCSLLSKSGKIENQGPSLGEYFITAYHGNIPDSSCVQDSIELFSTTDGLCPSPKKSQKVCKSIKKGDQKRGGRSRGFYVNDDDLLIAAIIKKKDFGTSCKKSPSKPEFSQTKASRKLRGQSQGCKLLPRDHVNGGKLWTDVKQFVIGARTVLGWLIDKGAVSLRDVVQFHNPKNHEVIKDGWVTRDGILCKCCTQVFSISDFKAHAGFGKQKPPLNLYLQSGKSFTLCQLQAWSTEYKSRKRRLKVMDVVEVDQNDDTCGICADGGELICCDNCPSTYHQSCLFAQELPEGSWYCSNCICKICNNLACKKDNSSTLVVYECSQCKHKYHGACIMEKVVHNWDIGSSSWFCGENCKKVFLGLRSRVGMLNLIDDGLSWTILKCNHDNQSVYSPLKIALMAECNSKLAIALSLMEECFLPMVDPRTGIDMVPHVLYNWGSDFARLNYEGFYTVILEKGDTLISVASIRVHGVKVAEMPLIATCGLQRRQKMCRRLMNSIEMMLRSLKVEMIVLSAIPSLVETWVSGFGFGILTAEEKEHLRDINLLLFPGTVLLQKKLDEEASFLKAGGNDQLCSAPQEGSEKCEGEDQPPAKDGESGLDAEYMPNTCHESPPRNISMPL